MADVASRSLRVVGRKLQAPIRSYRNGQHRRVWLVGLVHQGERRYFEEIKNVVQGWQARGAAVHYENIGMSEEEVAAANLSDAEREVFDFRIVSRADLDVYAAWGWVDQLDGFGCGAPGSPVRRSWPDGWEQHDLRRIDVLRACGVPETLAQLQTQAAIADAAAGSWLRRREYHNQEAASYWLQALGRRPIKSTDPVLLERRNDKAIADADQVAGDVVLLWGCSHLPGLDSRLHARGYTMAEESWHTVGNLPRMSTVAFWGLVTALATLPQLPQRVSAMRAYYLQQKKLLAQAAATPAPTEDDHSSAADTV